MVPAFLAVIVVVERKERVKSQSHGSHGGAPMGRSM